MGKAEFAKFGKYILSLEFLFLQFLSYVKSEKAILMDTRTALSDLGWTMPAGSEWQEMTSPDRTGNERRMLTVCQIQTANQNNWMRSPYIAVNGARRVYVEVEFTIRSCEDVPNVATCKETFNLYYYETDRDEATSTFPPWSEKSYTKVDTIAADQRFQPGSQETNFETRDIGPLTKNGIYLAVQDTGACASLMYVRVYYKYCDVNTTNLATFPRTITGPDVTSLEEAKGSCVRNAVAQANGARPSLYCNAEGKWKVPSGTCACTAGFEPSKHNTQCGACNTGYYKSSIANQACRRCPDYSQSNVRAATLCECMADYFRSPTDSANQPCTKPATKPVRLFSTINQTTVTMKWAEPLNAGWRNDLSYEIVCLKCRSNNFTNCRACEGALQYRPRNKQLTTTTVTITSLSTYSFYKIKICAVNGVTAVAVASGIAVNNCAERQIETNEAAPSRVIGLHVLNVFDNSFQVAWDAPSSPNGRILSYQVFVEHISSLEKPAKSLHTFYNKTNERQMTVSGLQRGQQYWVKVRARTAPGYGPFSAPVRVKTSNSNSVAPTDDNNAVQDQGKNNIMLLVVAVVGGIILFLVVGVVLYCLKKRTAKTLAKKKRDGRKASAFFNGNTVLLKRNFSSMHKTYIDPTTYEDPHRAILDFTKEIDTSHVKIEQVIGGGEFGEVCKGRLQLPNKQEQEVAVKTLKLGYNAQQKRDFLSEASIMGQFDHPNVIRLEGVVTRSRPLMIITEFMENGSLDTFLRKHDGRLSVIELCGMLRNIASGMKYLADMGYIHRDLAARNILVNSELICKVSDFGMSRVLEEDEEAAYTTRGGKIPIRWTAPEAITFRKFTSASDVWSYGIVMWEVTSYGERPYWGMSNADVMGAVESGYRLPAPMDCPQVLHKLMLDCWKKDRNQRPKFNEVVATLDKVLKEPIQLKIKAVNGRSSVSPSNIIPARPSAFPGSVKAPLPDLSLNGTSTSNENPAETTPLLKSSDTRRKSLRNQPEMTSLTAWLLSLGLSQYNDLFVKSGLTTMDKIQQLNQSDLIKMGITDDNHKEAIMTSINNMGLSGRREPGLPTYAESTMLHTGVPV